MGIYRGYGYIHCWVVGMGHVIFRSVLRYKRLAGSILELTFFIEKLPSGGLSTFGVLCTGASKSL